MSIESETTRPEKTVVYGPGTEVKFAGNDIKGVVTGVWIRDKGFVQYEIAYWNNGRQTAWVSAIELDVHANLSPMMIGFI